MTPASMLKRLVLACLMLVGLAACGDLPTPFMGNPGANARRLLVPLSPMLAVQTPTDALLPQAASQALAKDLAATLQAAEVPALARTPHETDWRLVTKAQARGSSVVPTYTVFDPKGEDQGTVEGKAVPMEAWASANPLTLKNVATEASSKVSTLLTRIRVARDRADPNSLYNRPAKVMVADVTGAPGDGNIALTRQMKAQLGQFGPQIQDSATGADFVVRGEVKVVPEPPKQERVEIQWVITTGTGDERGRVIQLNEIPAGTLSGYWGDIAVAVVNEASAGVNDVLLQQAGRRNHPSDADQAAAEQSPPPDPAVGAAAARR